jgi:hypothetical protein
MPMNPDRRSRGGDVEGMTKTDVEGAVGSPIEVAKASYDPGYELGDSLQYETRADLKQGYCSYGVAVGDERGKGYEG